MLARCCSEVLVLSAVQHRANASGRSDTWATTHPGLCGALLALAGKCAQEIGYQRTAPPGSQHSQLLRALKAKYKRAVQPAFDPREPTVCGSVALQLAAHGAPSSTYELKRVTGATTVIGQEQEENTLM